MHVKFDSVPKTQKGNFMRTGIMERLPRSVFLLWSKLQVSYAYAWPYEMFVRGLGNYVPKDVNQHLASWRVIQAFKHREDPYPGDQHTQYAAVYIPGSASGRATVLLIKKDG